MAKTLNPPDKALGTPPFAGFRRISGVHFNCEMVE